SEMEVEHFAVMARMPVVETDNSTTAPRLSISAAAEYITYYTLGPDIATLAEPGCESGEGTGVLICAATLRCEHDLNQSTAIKAVACGEGVAASALVMETVLVQAMEPEVVIDPSSSSVSLTAQSDGLVIVYVVESVAFSQETIPPPPRSPQPPNNPPPPCVVYNSFAPPECELYLANLVENNSPTSSNRYDEIPGYEGYRAVDGEPSTMWISEEAERGQFLEVDMGLGEYVVTQISILWSESHSPWNWTVSERCSTCTEYSLLYREKGDTTNSGPGDSWWYAPEGGTVNSDVVFGGAGIRTRTFLIEVTQARSPTSYNLVGSVGIREWSIFGYAVDDTYVPPPPPCPVSPPPCPPVPSLPPYTGELTCSSYHGRFPEDGEAPTSKAAPYTYSLSIVSSTRITAMACSEILEPSAIVEGTALLNLEPPTISPLLGEAPLTVHVQSACNDSFLVYTTNPAARDPACDFLGEQYAQEVYNTRDAVLSPTNEVEVVMQSAVSAQHMSGFWPHWLASTPLELGVHSEQQLAWLEGASTASGPSNTTKEDVQVVLTDSSQLAPGSAQITGTYLVVTDALDATEVRRFHQRTLWMGCAVPGLGALKMKSSWPVRLTLEVAHK
ncbi:hypothetical protein CYMTET_22456, partial [Cymbomonas tetramitiformis]